MRCHSSTNNRSMSRLARNRVSLAARLRSSCLLRKYRRTAVVDLTLRFGLSALEVDWLNVLTHSLLFFLNVTWFNLRHRLAYAADCGF